MDNGIDAPELWQYFYTPQYLGLLEPCSVRLFYSTVFILDESWGTMLILTELAEPTSTFGMLNFGGGVMQADRKARAVEGQRSNERRNLI